MAKKKVWLTWMPSKETGSGPEQSLSLLSQYGLDVSGNYWIDDLKKVAWAELAGRLIDSTGPDIWLIAGNREDFDSLNNRYGLSMVTAMVTEERGRSWKGICLGMDFIPEPVEMPTLMRDFQCISAEDATWPSKVVSTAFGTAKPIEGLEYRFNVIAHPLLGQWFEVGPQEKSWSSVMVGVSAESSITHHAVGARGQLPEKSLLEYPTEGIQAKIGDDLYTAWSVQNSISSEQSYFVKVDGYPFSVIIGGHPGDETAEVSRIELK